MNRSFTTKTLLISVFLFSSIVGALGQSTVSLFLKPDASSYKVATLPSNDSRLSAAAEMPYNANQTNLWKWVELSQTFEGHVRKSYVTKGLTIQVGAPVYFIPGDEDAFLTILEDAADAEVIQAAGDWVKISINTSVPVYFESDTPASAPVAAVSDPAEPVATPVEEPLEIESAVVQDTFTEKEPADLVSTNSYPREPIDRILEGKLVAFKGGFPNPFKKPTYQWQILNRGKKRIAFIDPTNLIIDRPIESYEGKQVSLSGSIYRINNNRDLVIVANQLIIQ